LPRLAGREVGDLRHAFEEMREALEGKKYVERYTQTLTHEIKAPLSAIRGAAELLDEKMSPEERAKFLGNIRHESARIQQIIDKLLQLSALEARKGLGPTEPVDLAQLAQTIVQHLRPTLHARRVTLDVKVTSGATTVVQGEKFLLNQALANLLQNAVEFAPPQSTVTLVFTLDERALRAVVEDDGPGIPAYAVDKVFDRFYSLPRPDTGVKSTGLGLSFVREIASLHSGEITLTNRAEGGCRAVLVLPV
jgi:two-component system sensor histidine kinase CreC